MASMLGHDILIFGAVERLRSSAPTVDRTMPILEPAHFSTVEMPKDRAFAEWRRLASMQYGVERAQGAASDPGGSFTYYPLDEIIANRAILLPRPSGATNA